MTCPTDARDHVFVTTALRTGRANKSTLPKPSIQTQLAWHRIRLAVRPALRPCIQQAWRSLHQSSRWKSWLRMHISYSSRLLTPPTEMCKAAVGPSAKTAPRPTVRNNTNSCACKILLNTPQLRLVCPAVESVRFPQHP